jgi:2,4-dienoyl-CoA reductase-like NADH-dependent reductase (Old Yellow Enzyme family)
MSVLFTEKSIGSLKLSNRMIRAASHEGLADERGRPTDRQFRFYEGFVKGGIGCIITGYAGILQSGKSALNHMTMIDAEELIPAHRELTRKIHAAGGKIILQIAHCGRQTWSGDTGAYLVAPSAVQCNFYREIPNAITEQEIQTVIAAFGKSAGFAREAGYDGVEVHGAHGYLLSTFLSKHANKRTDQWGGSYENRFRIVKETLIQVRKTVGRDFPVLIKLNTWEKAKQGIKPEECVQFAKRVEESGCCDAIELSCGTNEGGFTMARGKFPAGAILDNMRPYSEFNRFMKFTVRNIFAPVAKIFQPKFVEGYNLETASRVKQAVSLPIITVGGMRSKSVMEQAIDAGKTDFVSMARPLILEPDLPHKFKTGTSEKALCDNCNDCVVSVDTQPIQCFNRKLIQQMGKQKY